MTSLYCGNLAKLEQLSQHSLPCLSDSGPQEKLVRDLEGNRKLQPRSGSEGSVGSSAAAELMLTSLGGVRRQAGSRWTSSFGFSASWARPVAPWPRAPTSPAGHPQLGGGVFGGG